MSIEEKKMKEKKIARTNRTSQVKLVAENEIESAIENVLRKRFGAVSVDIVVWNKIQMSAI